MQSHQYIVRNIKDRLEALCLSATEASKRAGLAPTTLTRPLYDKNFQFKLSTSTLAALCGPLKCDLADLVKNCDLGEGSNANIRSQRAQRLSDLRGAAGFFTASQAARAAGVPVSTYIHHENGTREYDETAARLYADTFGSSVAWLLLGLKTPDQIKPAALDKLDAAIEQVEEINDLLHALDKVGDGIGGSDGFAVSAVAINAKSIADNLVNALKAMGVK